MCLVVICLVVVPLLCSANILLRHTLLSRDMYADEHCVDFSQFSSQHQVMQFLVNQGYRVQRSVAELPTLTWNFVDDFETYKRIYLVPGAGALEFKKFKEEPNDSWEAFSGLRPRVELVKTKVVLKDTLYRLRYEFSPVGVAQDGAQAFRGYVLQIFDHGDHGEAFPTLVVEIRGNVLYIQFKEVKNGRMEGAHIAKLADIEEWGGKQWFNLDVFFVISENPGHAFVRIYVNGQFAWERRAVNGAGTRSKANIQYGLYGPGGIELNTRVRYVCWHHVDGIPDTLFIADAREL